MLVPSGLFKVILGVAVLAGVWWLKRQYDKAKATKLARQSTQGKALKGENIIYCKNCKTYLPGSLIGSCHLLECPLQGIK